MRCLRKQVPIPVPLLEACHTDAHPARHADLECGVSPALTYAKVCQKTTVLSISFQSER